MRTGVIDVGGGLRGIYGAGVLDYCMNQGIMFDVGIGVSAGSANIAAYIAGQKRRNYQFYIEYSFRKKYMGIGNFLFKRSFIDLDYVYGTLSNSDGENPLGYQAVKQSRMDFIAVATEAETGKAKYFMKDDLRQNDYSVLKASCAIPVVCKPYRVQGVPYFDGALSDPIPVEKAYELGCERVVVILTKPVDVRRVPDRDIKLSKLIRRKYPDAAEKLRNRAELYNTQIERLQKDAEERKVIIIAPDDTCGVDTLTKNAESMERLYEKGYKDAQKIPFFLYSWGI
ncbi:MAG: patatin family protein [Enterocloster sp.]